ncbi:TonB-dependent receptor [uncultured Bacteroides sp.]|uniref:SusC/RagA family TonB-linked outer membrane protein n=2 Tax=uncultured Bacteroides sp. TaxID=162156 RepID=UPI0025B087FD|nr:TonB-dependent receptor [uncultured Bacteroides sp.]
MLKRLKSVSMMLFLMGASSGAAYAVSNQGADDVRITQQSGTCTGIVKDATGETVIGASVVVKGTTNGTITGIDGDFSLSGVKKGDIIQISFVGYITQEIVWNGTSLNVILKDDTQTLQEVVVVGFGTQKKVNLTGAVSTVDSKAISARPVNSVVDALQGAVAGMNFSVGSQGGALNSDKKFNIRGTGTIGAGSSVEALVLIDGMEGDINTLNPQDIENISVLKDASASSIYGSRAAGGVILVTTKSGKEGKTSINYNNSFRFNSPLNMPEMMDSWTWANYMNAASINAGSGIWFSDTKLQQIKQAQNDPNMQKMFANSSNRWEVWDVNDILPLGNTDWFKEHFGNSFSQEHTLSVNGGSEKIKYYFSANYLDQEGIMKWADEQKTRYAVTGKINATLAKWLKMNYSVRFNRTDFENPSYISTDGGLFYHNAARYWPIIPVKDPNGQYVAESNIARLTDGGRYKTQTDILAQQLSFQITPLDGWLINAELNYRIKNGNDHKDWLPVYAYDVDNNPYIIENNTSSVWEKNYKSNYFNPNIFTEYSHSLGDHNMKVMVGFQSEWLRQRAFTAQRDGIQAGLPSLDTTSDNARVSGGYDSWTTAGFFGRINYDYKGRYLVEGNLRYDGSSRFLRDNRWNWFPSVSAGWNIAQEAFWEDLAEKVNTLKLRASWGELGNQNTDSWYPFYPTIDYKTDNGNWLVDGKKPNTAAQPKLVSALLTWEKSRTWEIGLDWGAFNNRLTGSFGYFQRKTYDMVGPAQELPDILGAKEPNVNNLDMTSKGWDLQISWRDQINDFRYGVSLTLSDNQITIDKYPNPSKNLGVVSSGTSVYDGAKLGDIWGYTTIGIAKSQQEMDAHLAKADQSALGSNWTAGDIMYADLNGDGKVNNGQNTANDSGDLRVIGNTTPRYNFGLNLDAAWKGFDLKLFFQGTLKRDYAVGGGDAMFWGGNVNKWQATGFTAHLDYFRPDADDPLGQNLDSYYPRVAWDSGKNQNKQTRYLQNAAYCRLKNITLGYTLPQSLTEKFYVQNLRVFASAENLFTITSFSDLSDPELIDAGGWGFGKTYPLSKTVSLGLSVTF